MIDRKFTDKPYLGLWAKVILIALIDYYSKKPGKPGPHSNKQINKLRKQNHERACRQWLIDKNSAKRWFFADEPEFINSFISLCTIFELNPEYFRRNLKRCKTFSQFKNALRRDRGIEMKGWMG